MKHWHLTLMWLITQEDFSAFIHCESLKSYTSVNVVRLEGLSAMNISIMDFQDVLLCNLVDDVFKAIVSGICF